MLLKRLLAALQESPPLDAPPLEAPPEVRLEAIGGRLLGRLARRGHLPSLLSLLLERQVSYPINCICHTPFFLYITRFFFSI